MSGIVRHAVFGHPIAHSRSPWIHARFAAAEGIELRYEAIDTPPESFLESLLDFAADGGSGANVTLPLKQLAAGLCAELSESAARAGAVNTLIAIAGGLWRGDNTDGLGMMADLTRLRIPVRGQRILILGAGGSVRGILTPLLAARPSSLSIANRTHERAQTLAAEFAQLGMIDAVGLDQIQQRPAFDLVIHATSAYRGAAPTSLPPAAFAAHTIAYDLSYGEASAAFMAQARLLGAAAAYYGLGMLVEQAAESFQRWHGLRPQTAAVHAQLRALVQAS